MDYFMTNVSWAIVTPQWTFDTYSQRNWVEVFTGKPRDGRAKACKYGRYILRNEKGSEGWWYGGWPMRVWW
jgi:hypothetical protein